MDPLGWHLNEYIIMVLASLSDFSLIMMFALKSIHTTSVSTSETVNKLCCVVLLSFRGRYSAE